MGILFLARKREVASRKILLILFSTLVLAKITSSNASSPEFIVMNNQYCQEQCSANLINHLSPTPDQIPLGVRRKGPRQRAGRKGKLRKKETKIAPKEDPSSFSQLVCVTQACSILLAIWTSWLSYCSLSMPLHFSIWMQLCWLFSWWLPVFLRLQWLCSLSPLLDSARPMLASSLYDISNSCYVFSSKHKPLCSVRTMDSHATGSSLLHQKNS